MKSTMTKDNMNTNDNGNGSSNSNSSKDVKGKSFDVDRATGSNDDNDNDDNNDDGSPVRKRKRIGPDDAVEKETTRYQIDLTRTAQELEKCRRQLDETERMKTQSIQAQRALQEQLRVVKETSENKMTKMRGSIGRLQADLATRMGQLQFAGHQSHETFRWLNYFRSRECFLNLEVSRLSELWRQVSEDKAQETGKVKTVTVELERVQAENEKLKSERDSMVLQLEEGRQQLSQLQKQLQDEKEKHSKDVSAAVAKERTAAEGLYNGEIEKLKANHTSEILNLKSTRQKEIEAAESSIKVLQQQLIGSNDELNSAVNEKNQLQTELLQIRQELKQERLQHGQTKQDMDKMKKLIERLKNSKSKYKNEVKKRLKDDRAQEMDKVKAMTIELDRTRTENGELNQELEYQREVTRRAEQQVETLCDEVAELKSNEEIQFNNLQDVQEELSTAQLTIHKMEEQIRKFSNRLVIVTHEDTQIQNHSIKLQKEFQEYQDKKYDKNSNTNRLHEEEQWCHDHQKSYHCEI